MTPGRIEIKQTEGASGQEPDIRQARWASRLVVLLSLATGATDALSFMRLGRVFASVMTGNMVLLGVSVGRQEATLAAHAGVSFAAYVVGSAVGARVCGRPSSLSRWRQRARVVLGFEFVLFVGVTLGWELASAHPSGGLQLGLLAIAVIAMAMQAALSRSMPEETPPTTYLTGTLTAAISALMQGSALRDQQRRIGALVALVVGALWAALLVEDVPRAAPVLVLVLLLASLVMGAVDRHHAGWGETSELVTG